MSGVAFSDLRNLDCPVPARLRNGETVTIRRCTAVDQPAICAFLESLGPEARRRRFFTAAVDLSSAAHMVAAIGADRLGLSAFDRNQERVGHAVCIELVQGRAEVAVEVADRLCGQGLGTILLQRLAQLAERHGIDTLIAEVLPENRAMLEVFRNGFDATVCSRDGIDSVSFATASWRTAEHRFGGYTNPGQPKNSSAVR